MKRRLIVTLILLVAMLLPAMGLSENESMEAAAALDVVITIDQSSSMFGSRGSDPDGYRFEASAVLINMLKMDDSYAGIVLFGDGVISEYNYGDSTLNELVKLDKVGRELLLDTVTGREAREWTAKNARTQTRTDIEAGLEKALDLLRKSNTGNQRVILLVADGEIDLKGGDTANEESEQRVYNDLIPQVISNDVKVYTVLLRGKKIKESRLLSDIAEQTGGAYYALDSASELPKLFTEIYAAQVGSDPIQADLEKAEERDNGFYYYPISIPNNSMKELSIMVFREEKTTDVVKFYGGTGKDYQYDKNSFFATETEHCYIIKILNPAADSANGSPSYVTIPEDMMEDGVELQYVCSYNLAFEASLSADTVLKSGSFTVTAAFIDDGSPSTDELLYTQAPATVTVEAELADGKWSAMTTPIAMSVEKNAAGFYQYTATICPKDCFQGSYLSGTYRVCVEASGSGLLQEAEPMNIKLTSEPPKAVKDADEVSFGYNSPDGDKPTGAQTVSVKDCFSDPDGDQLTYAIESYDKEHLIIAIDGDRVTVEQRQKELDSKTAIAVSATDPDGGKAVAYIPVKVINWTHKYDDYEIRLSIDGTDVDDRGYAVLNKGNDYVIRAVAYCGNERIAMDHLSIQLWMDGKTMELTQEDEYSYIARFTTERRECYYDFEVEAIFGKTNIGVHKTAALKADVQNSIPEAKTNELNSKVMSWLDGNGGSPLAKLILNPGKVYWMDAWWIDEKFFPNSCSTRTSIDCSDYFTDADNDALTYQAYLNDEKLELTSGCAFILENLTEKGKYTLKLVATDEQGKQAEAIAVFETCSLKDYEIISVVLIIVALIAVILVLRMFSWIGKPLYSSKAHLELYLNHVPQGIVKELPPKGKSKKKPCKLSAYVPEEHQNTFEIKDNDIQLSPTGGNGLKVKLCVKNPPYTLTVAQRPVLGKKPVIIYAGDKIELESKEHKLQLGFEYGVGNE